MRNFATLLAALFAGQALGHSWIEQLVNIDSSGKYVGEFGYARSFVDKTAPGFDQKDDLMLIPSNTAKRSVIDTSDLLCHPNQRQQTQAQKYPRLQSAPGNFIAMRYAENGHVSQPAQLPGKPDKGGTTFVFGTTDPNPSETLANVLQWTKDGSGGNKKGVLLAATNFDDGRCHENSNFPIAQQRTKQFPNYAQGQAGDGVGSFPLMCETNVAIPKDAATGKAYTLYWVWQWPTEPGKDAGIPNGKDEYYATCMDVDVVESVKSAKASITLNQQDANTVAVSDYASRAAQTMDPKKGEIATTIFGGNAGGNAPSNAPSIATSVAQAPTTLQTSTVANSAPAIIGTASNGSLNIPTITNRPGHASATHGPPAAASGNANGNGPVTVTVTEQVTVTAPVSMKTISYTA